MRSVLVVHTRHPVGSLVAHSLCLSGACGKRRTRASTPPPADPFLIAQMVGDRQSGALAAAMLAAERLAGLLERARAYPSPACGMHVMHSKYEHMVADFDSWLDNLLAPLPMADGTRASLHRQLALRYGSDVAPGSQHALAANGQLAGLQPGTIAALRDGSPRLASLVQQLGYLWQPPFYLA
jgi:hypothetical protein